MTLDLLHGEARGSRRRARAAWSPPGGPAASCTPCSPTASTRPSTRGVTRPNVIKPETAHPAFDKACHLFGVELRRGAGRPGHHPGRRRTGCATTSTTRPWPSIGSACNYGYGTVDPIGDAVRHRPRARRRPARRRLPGRLHPALRPGARLRHPGLRLPRCPGVTSISADTHKYGYAFKGTSVLTFRDQGAAQRAVLLPDRLERREVLLPGHGGVALGRPARRHLGRHGPARPRGLPGLRRADLRDLRRHAGGGALPPRAAPPRAARPSCSRFTSDEFDIYHVNDFMRTQGLALQRPAVPQRAAHGRHPAPDPARVVDRVRRRPGRRRGLRQGARRRGARSPAPSTAAWPAA